MRQYINFFSILVSSFVELINYFVELPDFKGKYVLSERLSQDPIEDVLEKSKLLNEYQQSISRYLCHYNYVLISK